MWAWGVVVASDAHGFAGARVVGRRLCIAIFEGGRFLLIFQRSARKRYIASLFM
jgi:hypothetical protein